MSHTARFWNFLAKGYAASPIEDVISYEHKLAKTREYLTPTSDVLEMGCGTGSTALLHAPLVKHLRAIDISSHMIAIAQEKLDATDLNNLEFTMSSIDDLDIADESLDVVMGLSILHLVSDRKQVIARVYKMLKPGGVFITSTVCLGDEMKYLRFFTPIGRIVGLLLRVFSKQQLEQDFINNGYELDYIWQSAKGKAVFIIAKKPS